MQAVFEIVFVVFFSTVVISSTSAGSAAPTISVNDDITLKPGDEVSLKCVVDRDVSYFMMNSVTWDFKNNDGKVARLSRNFYAAKKDKNTEELISENRLSFAYHSGNQNIQVTVMISDLQVTDEGEYTCTVFDQENKIISEKTTKLTIVSTSSASGLSPMNLLINLMVAIFSSHVARSL